MVRGQNTMVKKYSRDTFSNYFIDAIYLLNQYKIYKAVRISLIFFRHILFMSNTYSRILII